MKIIGHTSGGLLVEMSRDEFAKACGYKYEYEVKDKTSVGTVANVTAAYDFHRRIANHEDKAKETAGTLRALAALLDGALPSVILPPAEKADEVQP